MMPAIEDNDKQIPWQVYAKLGIQTFIAFYISTFCMMVYFTRLTGNWIPAGIVLILLYLFILIASIKRIVSTLNAPALMLLVPIAPLVVLLTVVTSLPLIQKIS